MIKAAEKSLTRRFAYSEIVLGMSLVGTTQKSRCAVHEASFEKKEDNMKPLSRWQKSATSRHIELIFEAICHRRMQVAPIVEIQLRYCLLAATHSTR
jgi:hypothetical protein